MYTTETQIRVHYALTDQMGMVYHGNYAQFYEIGRAESIRNLGYTYKDIEAMGIIMPVVDIHSRFLRPAKYDDLLTVKTTLREIPLHHKIIFHSEIFNEKNELLNTGDVTLYFMNAKEMKRCNMPDAIKEKLAKYF
ncbi:MAG: acyl-CoA thioesterase [Bacteroidetes bacterium]|nr:acyl-CoA thioesterase [Bacteroidota bacterium]MBS1755892.1 acyl-CoA thioesterase [Bacteroidota bacterium]